MKIYILLIPLVLLMLVQCGKPTKAISEKETKSDSHFKTLYMNYMSLYQQNDKKSFLDSAMHVVEKSLKQYPQHSHFMIFKLHILSEKGKYQEAIQYLKSIELNVSGDPSYPYHEIILNRLHAMECIQKKDTSCGHQYLRKNIEVITAYLHKNEKDVNEYLKKADSDQSLSGPYFMALGQYLKFYAILYGKEKTYECLRKYVCIDTILYTFLEELINEDFMSFRII